MRGRKTIRFHTYTDDVVESAGQDYALPGDYEWVRGGWKQKLADGIFYRLGRFLAAVYGRFLLRLQFVNGSRLEECGETGFFLYGNHTQVLGDVLAPVWLCRGRHIYPLAAPANLGIPVIGRLLPYLGALPVPKSIRQLGALNQAIAQRIGEGGVVVIYPEAHVWPYYTRLRPFSAVSFRYPVRLGVPSYCMTTTYRSRGRGRPQVAVYVDGPFWPEGGTEKEQAEELCARIRSCMERRCKKNTCQYYAYQRVE